MHYQHLKNFISQRIRKNDIFVPAMILYLVRNDGEGTIKAISRLLYIFEYKHSLEHYETIVEKFTGVMLEEYNIVKRDDNIYKLHTWPLNEDEINDIVLECSKVANGFFKNLQAKERVS
jgi:hypothetical protein